MTRRLERVVALRDAAAATEERLAFVLRAPDVIERALRAALRSSLTMRRAPGRAPDLRAFGDLALETLDDELVSTSNQLNAIERHELRTSTLQVATAFVRTKLARRLFALPRGRFAETPPGSDAAVRDEHGRLHVVRLETCVSLASRAEIAREIATGLRATPRQQMQAPAIHLFSLRDTRLRTFGSQAKSVRHLAAKDVHGSRRAS